MQEKKGNNRVRRIIDVCMTVLLLFLMRKFKKHPVVYIALSALAGIIIGF